MAEPRRTRPSRLARFVILVGLAGIVVNVLALAVGTRPGIAWVGLTLGWVAVTMGLLRPVLARSGSVPRGPQNPRGGA